MKTFRIFLHLVLALALAIPPSAKAGSPEPGQSTAFEAIAKNYGRVKSNLRAMRLAGQMNAALKEADSQWNSTPDTNQKPSALKSVGQGAASIVGHHGQALVLILILSGVELVRREIEMSRLKKTQSITWSF